MDQAQAKNIVTFSMIMLGVLVLTAQGYLKIITNWISGQTK